MEDESDKRSLIVLVVIVIIILGLKCITHYAFGKSYNEGFAGEMFVQQTAWLSQTHDMVFEIVPCEGDWCDDAQNPISTAFGACQFLDGTWDYVQKKWGMKLDRNSYEDQLYACDRLMREEGLRHWYASISCWGS